MKNLGNKLHTYAKHKAPKSAIHTYAIFYKSQIETELFSKMNGDIKIGNSKGRHMNVFLCCFIDRRVVIE